MNTLTYVNIAILLGSILLCNPAEGIKNQTMSPHHGKAYEEGKTNTKDTSTETKSSNSSSPSQNSPSPSISNTPSASQNPKGEWTNKYDIKVVFIPSPGKNEKDGQLTLIFTNKDNVAHPLKLEKNPLVIPAGSLKAMIADLSDAHHNKEGKVIDAQGKVVPSGSIKSPDGFETYVDRNLLPPGIGCSYSYFTTGPNNGQFTIDSPNLTHIIVSNEQKLALDYIQKDNITGSMKNFLGEKITMDKLGGQILVYKPS